MQYCATATILLTLLLATGCSDANFDYGTPIKPGMSIRVTGNTHKRILYDIRQHEIHSNGSSSFSSYGNCQVKKSNNERLEIEIENKTNGCAANVLVPFDDEVTLELVLDGEVLDSRTSTKAGTVLTLELGKLPKDRSTWLTSYELESRYVEFRDNFHTAISNGQPNEIEGYSFLNQQTGDDLKNYINELEETHGEFAIEAPSHWIHIENDSASMLQGSLQFGKKTVPIILGIEEDKSIHFVVVEFAPGEKWAPIEQWRTNIDSEAASVASEQ